MRRALIPAALMAACTPIVGGLLPDADDLCGNGVLQTGLGEDCDGADLGGRSCVSEGFIGGQLSCNDDCTINTQLCFQAQCGNNEIEAGEVCDGSDLNGADCSSVGKGFNAGELLCTDDCTQLDSSGCTVCGDAILTSPETCDDGNTQNGDGCNSQCQVEVPNCGNGVVEPVPSLARVGPLATEGGPVGITTGDLNNDGTKEIVTANFLAQNLSIFPNAGGVLQPSIRLVPQGALSPFHPKIADLNNDGNNDIVFTDNGTNQVGVFLHNPTDPNNLAFEPVRFFPTGGNDQPNNLDVSDLDRDGDLDLIITNNTGTNFAILENLTGFGALTFAAHTRDVNSTSAFVVAADLDVNGSSLGFPELTMTLPDLDTLLTLTTASGSTRIQNSFNIFNQIGVPNTPVGLVIGDIGNNFILDAVVGQNEGDALNIFLGNGSGLIPQPQALPSSPGPVGLAAGDFNNDHLGDIAIASPDANVVTILFGTPNLQPIVFTIPLGTGASPTFLVAEDINRDGITDLAVSRTLNASIDVFLFGLVFSGEECDGQGGCDPVTCQFTAACGDGLVQDGEECDDANNINQDSCINLCRFARCGDSFVQPPNGENCDGGVGCNPTCRQEACNDDLDNNGNGLIDCADPACIGTPGCNQESGNCSDNLDNDNDSLIDCADTAQCPASVTACLEGPNCFDGKDNDNDGTKDCADGDCATTLGCF